MDFSKNRIYVANLMHTENEDLYSIILMYLFQVNNNDIIIMGDIDAFPMRRSLLEPFENFPNKKVWIFQYDATIQNGWTFAMTYTGT